MHVAVGVIVNHQGKILIAKRPAHQYKGGFWEFPGGKVELGETPYEALQRELREEVNLYVVYAKPWLTVSYNYQDRTVMLDTWLISQFEGMAEGREGQEILWVKAEELSQFQFPEGNRPIIDKLLLESCLPQV